MKRAFDLIAAGAGLFVLSPVLGIVWLAVRLTSPGPALFRHERIGKDFEPFDVLKFRTMRNDSTGANITTAGDDRITSVGRILRQYKIDELPQLINVVRGEMSIVGPRPEVKEYVDLMEAYQTVLQVRPGLTDPASLEYRHEQDLLDAQDDPKSYYTTQLLPEKVRLSVDYVHNRSFRTDIELIFQTLKALAR